MIYLGLAVLILLFYKLDYQMYRKAGKHYDTETHNALAPIVGGIPGMQAFLLAFTFAMALSRHNLRREWVLDEANIILRADLIHRKYGDEIKKLFKWLTLLAISALTVVDLARPRSGFIKVGQQGMITFYNKINRKQPESSCSR